MNQPEPTPAGPQPVHTPAAETVSARQRSLVRKIVYLAAIGVLLMPLFWLSHPATRGNGADPGRPGGKLAQLRQEHHLNQADIGQIDMTTETLRLSTLGMRGVACLILWNKANTYQMKKDWTNLRATLEQISKLQPHSIGVWRFQCWNLSYNVSVAFDDYRDKYYWVMEGIKFIQKGMEVNEHDARIVWDLGWFISQKIGRDDCAALYRKLFKEDDQFHGSRPLGLRDNWLVGKEKFKEAEGRVDEQHPLRGLADVVFYSHAPMCHFYYGSALEKEGEFGELAQQAWRQAEIDWRDFGDRRLPGGDDDKTIRLNDQERYEEAAAQASKALEAMEPGLRKKIEEERFAQLAPKEKEAWKTPAEKRTVEQQNLAYELKPKMDVSDHDLANRIKGAQRKEARRLSDEAEANRREAGVIRRNRSIINFDYWRMRAVLEQHPDMLAARRTIYAAEQALARADFQTARSQFEDGMKRWRNVLDNKTSDGKGKVLTDERQYKLFSEDTLTIEDLADVVRRYRRCLKQQDPAFTGKLPKDFILQDIMEKSRDK